MITVALPDGTTLQFPDGTPDAVIQSATRRAHDHLSNAPAGPVAAPQGLDPASIQGALLTGSPLDLVAQKRAELADVGAHGDLGHVDIPDPGVGRVLATSLKQQVGHPLLGALRRFGQAAEFMNPGQGANE